MYSDKIAFRACLSLFTFFLASSTSYSKMPLSLNIQLIQRIFSMLNLIHHYTFGLSNLQVK